MANRGGSHPPRTEPWRRGAVRGANRTVGVAHGSVRLRTEPHGSRFEPWSTLGRGDLRENPACRCPGFPSRTLPRRPSSGRLQFSRPFSVWPLLLQCCLPLFLALRPVSFSSRQLMLIWLASLEGEAISCLSMWTGRNTLLFCVRPFRIFGSRLHSFGIHRPRPPEHLSLLP